MLQLMDDLRSADVDFLTIGQYLQPTRKHHPVMRFVTPDEFKAYETIAYTKGFLMVASSPLTRSSHHAGEDFARLRAAREAQLTQSAERLLHAAIRNASAMSATRRSRCSIWSPTSSAIRNSCRSASALTVRSRKERDGRTRARRRHDGRLQGDPRDLHQPGAI